MIRDNVWVGWRVDKLRELWPSAYTAQEIADILGVVSRKAVIGKAFRMGLPRKDKTTRTNLAVVEIKVKPIAVKKTCAWPIGHPNRPNFHYCGDENVVEGKPYCKKHCDIAYVPYERIA